MNKHKNIRLKVDWRWIGITYLGLKDVTLRYKPPEGIDKGSKIDFTDPDGELFCTVRVTDVCEITPEAFVNYYNTRYHIDTLDELVELMNGYYDEEIHEGTVCKAIEYYVVSRVDDYYHRLVKF